MALIPRMLPAGISSCSLPLQTTTRVSRKTMLLPSKLTALLLFLLIDLQLLALIIKPIDLLPIAFAVPLAVVPRLISVAVPLGLTRESLRNKARDTAVLTWAGSRGGISIALALTLPDSPWRVELLVTTYAVVIFTIVVQGLTMPRLVRLAYGVKEPNLDRLRSKQPRVLGFVAWSRDRREMPRCRSRRAASPARVRPSRPRFLLAPQGRAGRRSGRAEYGLWQVE
jgi:hypothetical protein